MSELGETLRKARIERGLTLEELEETTKIRKRYLEAIESQNFEVLPGNFYVRAFIKNYAEAVGLDPSQIMELYQNVIPPTETSQIEVTRPPARTSHSNVERWSKWASAFLMISFFLLIVLLIYFYFYQTDPSGENVLDETPITERLEEVDPEGNGSDSPIPEQDEPVVQEPEPEPEPEPEVTFVNSSGSLDIYTISNADAIRVELEIIGAECWVSVNKDGRDGELIYMGTLSRGDTMSWEYEGAVWIRLGQASSAAVTVNDIPLEPFEHPNVRDLQLNLAISEDTLHE